MIMTRFGQEMLSEDRLNPVSNLSNPESDGYKLFDFTIGYELDKIDDEDLLEQLFLVTATGDYLDLHGNEKGIYRMEGESDDDYRNRINWTSNFNLNIDSIEKLEGLVVCYVEILNTQVTSKNDLLSNEYIIEADDNCKKYINRYVNNRIYHYLDENDISV